MVDGQTYYAIKVDEHNFKIASTYTLATNSTPSPLTIGTGNIGGNSADTFDPGKNLYVSAGKTISASQFSFPVDSSNDTNALNFGLEPKEMLKQQLLAQKSQHQLEAIQLIFISQ